METKEGKFIKNLQAKHNTKVEDAEAMKAKPIKVENLLNDMNSIPTKITVSGPIGETSVRKTKTEENPLHAKDKKMAGE